MADPKEVVVFFSWQTDSPEKTNRRAIRDALSAARSRIEETYAEGLQLSLDEATRGVSGSPNIPQQIMDKIDASDIFVCDVTIINGASAETRKMPNPNVTFELGYAVAQLGWSRIIMLLNEAYGPPEQLPFDFDRHRVSKYKIENPSTGNVSRAQLDKLLSDAIEVIIKQNPKKAKHEKALTPEQERHKRDVRNLRLLLEDLHVPTVEAHIRDAPKRVSDRIIYFWDGFKGCVDSRLFHIYDEVALAKVRRLYEAWGWSLSFGDHYDSSLKSPYYFFVPQQEPWSQDDEETWDEIETSLHELAEALDDFLADVRVRYLEIDIDALSQVAWERYVAYHQEFEKIVSRRAE